MFTAPKFKPNSSCTAYVVPSDGPSPDPVAKARRVREQVRMRLAERKSSSLSRLEGSTGESLKAAQSNGRESKGFSSRSMINTPSRAMAVPAVPLPASGFSSRSSVDTTSRLTHKGAAVVHSSSQTSQVYSRSRRSKSLTQGEHEALPVTSSGRLENPLLPLPAPPPGTLRRSLSGILAQEKGCWQEEELPQQYTYKGPSHRTISRITNRQQHYQQQQSSSLGQEGWVGNGRGVPPGGDTWGTQWQQQQQQHVSRTSGTMHRAASLRSLRSVGKGVDVFDGASIHSNDPLGEGHVSITSYVIRALMRHFKEIKDELNGCLFKVTSHNAVSQSSSCCFIVVMFDVSEGFGRVDCLRLCCSDRNLSSVNERTRQKMREMPGLVDSLVTYIQQEEQGDEKVSHRGSMMSERRRFKTSGAQNHQNLPTLSQPKGSEWLWHPKVVGLYKLILQNSDYSSCSREAAIGALQNITAGDARWASVLSMVIIEKERMLPILLDRLDTNSDTELRPLSGLLRNLTRHATDKQHMGKSPAGTGAALLSRKGFGKRDFADGSF
uniref:Plakophilin 3b n=1 Tax=Neolamprologus brichardi TaxID=32507 RepID=A0A3Q4M4A7_NEOBR